MERRVACRSRIPKLRLDLNRSSTRASEYISRARAHGRWRSRSSPRCHESTRGLLSSSRRKTREVNRHRLSGADDARLGAESRSDRLSNISEYAHTTAHVLVLPRSSLRVALLLAARNPDSAFTVSSSLQESVGEFPKATPRAPPGRAAAVASPPNTDLPAHLKS